MTESRGLTLRDCHVQHLRELRGGISIALAFSLPEFQGRDLVLGVTYVVVFFSVLVQATTLGLMVRHFSSPTTISEQTALRK